MLALTCLSLSLSPHEKNRLPPDGFDEIWYFNVFRTLVEKLQVSLKSDMNNGTLHVTACVHL